MNEKILENFLSLCAIPRKSHHEERVSRFLYDWAVSRGLAAVRDTEGNVIIDKPGVPGAENAPTVILQAHMDMVCVAEDGREYDPLADPIRPILEGNTLTADGTSLGGDDGAGVALAMTILEDGTAVHGPLRAIFTVDEEDGMSGANAMDSKYLQGDYLINLDWEEFGSLCCSSAGSDMYSFSHPADWESAQGMTFYALTVQGLEGGHSGAQIHLGRANAIRMAANILSRAMGNRFADCRLCAFRGGSAHNAIPASASAVVAVPADFAGDFLAAAAQEIDSQLEACALTDPGAVVTVVETGAADKMLGAVATRDILGMLTAVHDGVNTWSASIPGLVESSANTGLAALEEDRFAFLIHQRSSEPALTAEMKKVFAKQAEEHGFAMTQLSSGAPWPVKRGSALLELCQKHFRQLFGRDIRVEPVHAGLECGAWASKNPGLDIISIGPTIADIHSPRETLYLDTVYDCDALVRSILRELAGK